MKSKPPAAKPKKANRITSGKRAPVAKITAHDAGIARQGGPKTGKLAEGASRKSNTQTAAPQEVPQPLAATASTAQLQKQLDQLIHDNPKEFVRLIAQMVARLEEPSIFRDVAAMCTSWPVNVPALRTVPGMKPAAPGVWQEQTREEKCKRVLDDLLAVGSATGLNLVPAKLGGKGSQLREVAREIANTMQAIRNCDPARLEALKISCSLACGIGSDHPAYSRFCKWFTAARRSKASTTSRVWSGLAWRCVIFRYSRGWADGVLREFAPFAVERYGDLKTQGKDSTAWHKQRGTKQQVKARMKILSREFRRSFSEEMEAAARASCGKAGA